MRLHALQQHIQKQLQQLYDLPEARTMAKWLLEDMLDVQGLELAKQKEQLIGDKDIKRLSEAVERLLQHEPLQYVTGKAWFMHEFFAVNKHVLIPRPETEELVQWIINDTEMKHVSVLDIGTGSGCIAIMLKRVLQQAIVYATDVSNEALQIASTNARQLQAAVTFLQHDVLLDELKDVVPAMNVVVSNPPYITQNEKPEMRPNVLQYEPQLALFCDEPLQFYKAITMKALDVLVQGGSLYFEISEKHKNEVEQLLHRSGYTQVEARTDIHGKWRMLKAVKA